MTKKGRWWWVTRELDHFNQVHVVYVYKFKTDIEYKSYVEKLYPETFRALTGLKLKPSEVRKVRLEWEE